jgi:predicted DsbA family dithiol-disulfide isomerase
VNGTVQPPSEVDFYFDTMCPFAFHTSLWIREVRRLTGLVINWRFFSLEEINRKEDQKHPWERPIAYGWTPLRIAAHLRRQDPDLCDRWYLACGTALHIEGRRPYERDVAVELLAGIGVSAEAWDDALADHTTHDDVRADHEHATSQLGGFGVPIIVAPQSRAVFGPVVVPAPMGDDALVLWQLVVAYGRFPGLYEIKTPKTDDDMRRIGDAFTPYLANREWQTIQHPAR